MRDIWPIRKDRNRPNPKNDMRYGAQKTTKKYIYIYNQNDGMFSAIGSVQKMRQLTF